LPGSGDDYIVGCKEQAGSLASLNLAVDPCPKMNKSLTSETPFQEEGEEETSKGDV